jgi:lipopolysaccharide cholinephosphotransferase
MLRILKIFDYLCAKHNIEYFLTGGTLLGSIRHKGFIPWDDDIDVGMTRINYEKFLKLAAPELPVDIFLQNQHTDHFYPKSSGVDARLRDKYSNYNPTINDNSHQGMQVDIFVYDRSFPPNNLFIAMFNKGLKYFLNSNHRRAQLLKWISKWVPLPMVYCSNFMIGLGSIKKGTYVKPKELSTLIRTKFEDMEALIPSSYDSYLRRQYGEYMKLPPLENRISHHKVKPNPFTPCNHPQVLFWKDRKITS